MPGEDITFGLVLVGRAIDYLPYFIVVLREPGAAGLGRGRKKCFLKEVLAVNPLRGEKARIYSEADPLVRKIDMIIRGSDIPGLLAIEQRNPLILENAASVYRPSRLTVNYLTMTRLKYEESYVDRVEFHILIRSLLRRFSSLAYFHHGEELKLDFTGLIDRARQVRLVEDHTAWVDWERFSSRQDTRMKMGGVVGKAVYEGDLDIFLPLLRLGELVHVGKGAVFGMGKYQINREQNF